ncbi:hypothetical protein MPSEU_000617500 [Mayamaea pseudoterrestris]|nr:hypothetical protein MPSEU_000617500 [Mayamaea pseudoterrestris]
MKMHPQPFTFASEHDDVISLESLGKGCFDPTVRSPVHSRTMRRESQEAASLAKLDLPCIYVFKAEVLDCSSGRSHDFSLTKDDFETSKCRRVNHKSMVEH